MNIFDGSVVSLTEDGIRENITNLYRYELRHIILNIGRSLSESFLREIRDYLDDDECIVTYCQISDDFARELGCIEKDTKWV